MIQIFLLLAASFLFGVTNSHEFKSLPFDVSWMSAKDQTELSKIDSTSQRGRFLTAVYEKADADEKSEIRKEVLPSCYASWMSAEDREELEALHESGNHEKCKERVHELLNQLSEEKRAQVQSYWSFCEHLWYGSHEHVHHAGHQHSKRHSVSGGVVELRSKISDLQGRHTRHSQSDYESFAAEHLTWMSDEERKEVKNLHGESKEKAHARVFELLDSATGEKREKAISQLQAACRELIAHTFGEETVKTLKQMKESGLKSDDIGKKIGEMLNGLTDETKKAKVLEYKDSCKKVYEANEPERRRRDSNHHHGLESKLKSEWKWLTDAQKEEIRGLKNQGKNDEFLLTRVFEFFKSAESKDAAEDGLQQSCGGAILTILGPEKSQILKDFMADGAKPEVYEAKVKELLNQQDKEASRKSLSKNQENCKLVFTAATRFRREDHSHKTLEEYLSTHLNWLTDAQKTEVRQMKANGQTRDELHSLVMKFFDSATGEVKEKATSELQASCHELYAKYLSAEQMEELKKLKQGGASKEELKTKGKELVSKISDPAKKKDAEFYSSGCEKVFGVSR